ncbi:MAG: TRAP transporter large permease subunit [Deltaproteobacteria bacterium]|nr:MAG: TRAP transporter large permease subunit [Deltaproteobacteria bacterium]
MTYFLFSIALVILAIFGMPLFAVIAGFALLGFYLVLQLDPALMIVEMYRLASAPMLIALPLFTFAGYLLAESKASTRLVNFSKAFMGWSPGGLAIVALATCAMFTALTGASGVTIIAIGGLLFPALIKEGYTEKFSLGLITSSGSLGLLFPPSLPLIIYGIVSETSVEKLFIAGIVPGVLLVIMLSVYGGIKGTLAKVPRMKLSIRAIYQATRSAVWEIPIPFIILGGIYLGLLTASEAAAVVAFYILIVEIFIYRDIKLRNLPSIMVESMVLVGGILIIMGAALGLTNYLIDQQVPMKLLDFMKIFIKSKITFLMMLNGFLLIVGCMMDIFSATVVVVPLIVPVARAFGIDPIHLGIIFLTNLEIGYSTPPVGINLFISSFRLKKPVLKLYAASIPFLVILFIALLIITYVPDLSLYLVKLMAVKQ